MHKKIQLVTKRIKQRSINCREIYLKQLEAAHLKGPNRSALHCGNLAHAFAACSQHDKASLRGKEAPNIAIISAYNDILSAHQPYESYPKIIKQAVHEAGGVAQFAGGVPAMCDGVTQGQPGMELSLMSRDVIALAATIGLTHNMFDGGLMLGICDKIVPGLLLSALRFSHLPFVFVPAGPMPSGIPNPEKARVRQLYAQGKVGKEALLDVEAASYHSPGTCTFYGTANSNQLIVEMMGLHLPGASFINPNTLLREQLTQEAARRVLQLTALSDTYLPIGQMVDEHVLVNGIVGWLATGGSTNHTMHLVAIARAAGFIINWDDFADLSEAVPLLAKIYPNGSADINHFQEAGGMAYLIHTLLEAGLLHEAVNTIVGFGLARYTKQPELIENKVTWAKAPVHSENPAVLTSVDAPFKLDAGLKVLTGNIGRAIFKTSALPPQHAVIKAPAHVFSSQEEFNIAFRAGTLNHDVIAVVRFQGPKACGMPELHQLTPALGVLQQRGYKVALVTDGRMSGASGRVPAAIHVTPEALDGGLIAKIETGDLMVVDGENSVLQLLVSDEILAARELATINLDSNGLGRELFAGMRSLLTGAEEGACSLFPPISASK
jgi:phosphogluconate dehydratase